MPLLIFITPIISIILPILTMFDLPFKIPTLIITVLLVSLLLAPLVSRTLKFPSIIGLILAGAIVGPHGLGLLEIGEGLKLLGEIGLVLIIFLAGIELDFNKLQENKQKSIVFGLITLSTPFIFGFLVLHFFLGFHVFESSLVALMFSTQTLVSYPIVSRLGLANNRSSITAIGGTIIADAAILFTVGILIASNKSTLTLEDFLVMFAEIIAFLVVVSFVFPRIVKYTFKHIEDENYFYFTLIFALLFVSATLAHMAHFESIIGAFLAGIVLNRYIPKKSALMSNLQFAGNAIFIPCFLFFVGTFIDFNLIFDGYTTIKIAIVLIVIAILTKYIAAFITGKIFKFSKNEILLLFGLTNSHAAAIIAVVMICYSEGIIDSTILNAAVLLVAVSCIISSFVTERAGRKLVLSEKSDIIEEKDISEKILVPYANPNNITKLLDIAVSQFDMSLLTTIYPLSIFTENDSQYRNKFSNNQNIINNIISNNYPDDIRFNVISRLDTDPVSGILRAIKELMATTLVIGWTGRQTKFETLGKNIDLILEKTDLQTLVCHIKQPLNIFTKLYILVPEHVEYEKGFHKWLQLIHHMSGNIGGSVIFISQESTSITLKKFCQKWKINLSANYVIKENIEVLENFLDSILDNNSLLFFILAREKSVSSDSSMDELLRFISTKEQDKSFIILVPEQNSTGIENNTLHSEISQISF